MADVIRPFSCEALINGTWTPPFPTEGADYAECAGTAAKGTASTTDSADAKAVAFGDAMAAETLATYLRGHAPAPSSLATGLAQPKAK